MSNEKAAFQDALDASPDDHTVKLVFADWLEEHDDPRAEGYRALGMLRKTPWWFVGSQNYGWFSETNAPFLGAEHLLPDDWIALIPLSRHVLRTTPTHCGGYSIVHLPEKNNRVKPRVLFQAAAAGFSRLPAERRAELLQGVLV